MSRIRVKICGITEEDSLKAAVDAGADALGFVFADSPRQLTLDRALELNALVPPFVDTVAVFLHEPPAKIAQIARQLNPDWIQCDASNRPASPPRFLPVYRTSDAATLLAREPFGESAILFEGASSGVGEVADWNAARELAARTRLVLAGGLTPGSVGEAIRQVRPWAVDVSSGVECRRGVKDPERIRQFLAAVRDAENS